MAFSRFFAISVDFSTDTGDKQGTVSQDGDQSVALGKLNQKKIEALKDKGRYGDGRNLFLHVGPTGAKSWLFLYRINGRYRQMGLGSLRFVGLEAARTKAAQMREMVKDGVDPLELKPSKRKPAGRTFEEVAEAYIAKTKPEWKNGGKSEIQWRQTLRDFINPVIGKMDVADIKAPHVRDVLEEIWVTKPDVGRKVRQRIGAILAHAAALELRDDSNPARAGGSLDELLPKWSKVKRKKHFDSMPYADLPAFISDLRERDGVSARALEFLILTTVRKANVLEATWDEFDLDKRQWVIPAERMKGGEGHIVPLSPRAVAILEHLIANPQPRSEGNDFVFVSPDDPARPLSDGAFDALLKRMGRKDGVTTHGFRSTFSDWVAEETDHQHLLAEKALAHADQNRVRAAYQRGNLLKKRKALMDDWADYCDGKLPLHGGDE